MLYKCRTIGSADRYILNPVTSGITVTLPDTSTLQAGDKFIVTDANGNASSNSIVVRGNGSQTVTGIHIRLILDMVQQRFIQMAPISLLPRL